MRRARTFAALAAVCACAARAPAQPVPAPHAEAVAPLPAGAAADVARQVALELKSEAFSSLASRFDEALSKALPETQLRIFWADTLATSGVFRGCGPPRIRIVGEYALAFSDCTFEKKKAELRLTLHPDGRLAGLFLAPANAERPPWSPPAYVRPDTFTERELVVTSGLVSLPATLATPRGEGPFPGVVLVHGSGPQDRDETVGGVRVFQDLAQGLASRGVAVLRYEKRTKAYQKELAGTRDMRLKDEVLDDAVAAIALLRAQPGVDPARIVVVGHSLGGILAPRIALLDRKAAAVVLMAAPSRPMSEVVRDQVAVLGGPASGDVQRAAAAGLEREADALRALYAGEPVKNQTIFGASPSYWLELKSQTPLLAAQGLGLPVLVLQGGRDYQVSMKDFEGWSRALADTPRAFLKAYPKLNHLFVAGEGPSLPAEYEAPAHVAAEVIEDVATFVKTGALPRPEKKR